MLSRVRGPSGVPLLGHWVRERGGWLEVVAVAYCTFVVLLVTVGAAVIVETL